jgi:hypothetical protein
MSVSFEKQLSNYECRLDSGYLSYWPAPKKGSFDRKFLNDVESLVGMKLFDDVYDPVHGISRQIWRENILKDYIRMLIAENLGAMDTFLYFFPELNGGKKGAQGSTVANYFNSMDIRTVTCHLFELEIKSVSEASEHCIKVNVGSNEFNGKTLDFFLIPEFGEQTASDVVPILVVKNSKVMYTNTDTNISGIYEESLYTVLANKAKQPYVKFTFSDGEVLEVLSIGLYGTAIAGETLTPDEKKSLTDVWSKFDQNSILKVDSMSGSTAVRTSKEELGLKCTDDVTMYLIGKDDSYYRDKRFFEIRYNGKMYGYDRKSTSYVFVIVKVVEVINNNFNPEDTDEIESTRVVSVANAIKNFDIGKKYEPAFSSHVTIFRDIVCPKLLNCLENCLSNDYSEN